MIKSPRLKPHLTPFVIPDEGVLLLAEDNARALHGTLYERIIPLLDGTRSADDLVASLANAFDAAHVYYALMMLEKNGHLIEAVPNAILAEQAAFWSGLDLEPAAAAAALAAQSVVLLSLGDVDPELLQEALANLGIMIQDEQAVSTAGPSPAPTAARIPARAPALTIVLTDDYLRPGLAELNDRFRTTGHPWLLLKSNGFEPWIGPLYQGAGEGCHACLQKRLAANRQSETFAARYLQGEGPLITARAALPASRRIAAELAALEVAKHLAGAASSLHRALFSLDSRTLSTQTHRLLPDPYCPVCGTAPKPQARPIELISRKVHFMQDGGHRHVAPDETLRRYEHLVSRITGIVTKLESAHENAPAKVYVAGHNAVFKMEKLDHLKRGLRNASAGKGVSATQAKTSALCEALERYSGQRQGDEVIITASLQKMQAQYGEDVIHPNAVMRFSERQLAEHATWNALESLFNRVCEPLDEDLAIDWTPVWSLTHQRHQYLPTQLLYYRCPASQDCDRFFAYGCSNGNASGNTLEEAILQGFFELVERDATALWWYNRLRKPEVNLASFSEPWLLDLVDFYDGRGRDSWALNLTSDLGIPAFVAISRQRAGEQDRLVFGLGCHLDARIALQRAFAELNQMLGVAQEQPENGSATIEDEETHRWLTTATLENQPYLAPDPDAPACRSQDFAQRHSDDLLCDIALCREIVESRGMQMLVLDQTRPDVGLPVAKVLVPGLRHFWARFGPGRLYDVPVEMGWLQRPLTEDELNPIPIFF